MLDSCLVSSYGNLNQENGNIPRLPLTNDQKDLIDNNYTNILAYTRGIIKQKIQKKLLFGNADELTNRALDYILEATQEYNPELNPDYVRFIGQRCVWRLIDFLRMETRWHEQHISINYFQHDIIDETRDIDDVDWDDAKTFILSNLDQHFIEHKDPRLLTITIRSQLNKMIIRDYILPKIENLEHPNLKEIGKRFGLTESRMSQLVRNQTIHSYINSAIPFYE
jgi:DNA-directed RNA polymerase specialized sigma subunit